MLLDPADGRLLQYAAPEVGGLRVRTLFEARTPTTIEPNATGHVPASAFGAALELQATFALPPAAARHNSCAGGCGGSAHGSSACGGAINASDRADCDQRHRRLGASGGAGGGAGDGAGDGAGGQVDGFTFGLSVRGRAYRAAPAERAFYDVGTGELGLGGLSGEPKRSWAGIAATAPNVTLRLFLDRSVCEAYTESNHRDGSGPAGGGAAITSRLFPDEPLEAIEVDVFATGKPARLLELTIWELGSMWGKVTVGGRCAPRLTANTKQ